MEVSRHWELLPIDMPIEGFNRVAQGAHEYQAEAFWEEFRVFSVKSPFWAPIYYWLLHLGLYRKLDISLKCVKYVNLVL